MLPTATKNSSEIPRSPTISKLRPQAHAEKANDTMAQTRQRVRVAYGRTSVMTVVATAANGRNHRWASGTQTVTRDARSRGLFFTPLVATSRRPCMAYQITYR